ncbi:MAG TPA: hypothetical protein VFS35_06850 [Terrimicrobiaceae bacterium]|nr:hypothetical protein [Terrimicrobiaceae bacterium]
MRSRWWPPGSSLSRVCRGAPYGPPFTGFAKGDVPRAVGLMVILAGSSAILAPMLLSFLLPMMTKGAPLKVDAAKMVTILLVNQRLPLLAGLFVRQWRPELALKSQKPANKLSAALNLVVFAFILVVQFKTLTEIKIAGFTGMSALLVASVAAGWLFGGPGSENGRAMALTTSVRNAGVSLVIAMGSFPGTAAVTAALAYALFQTIIMVIVAMTWGRLGSTKRVIAERAKS